MGVRQAGRQVETSELSCCLGKLTRQIAALARETSEKPNSDLLVDLRELERKMKLVLTLVSWMILGSSLHQYRASVFMAFQESRFEAEAEAAEEQDDQTVGQYHQSDASLQQRWDDQWQGDESTIMR